MEASIDGIRGHGGAAPLALGRRAGFVAVAYAFAVAMLGTTLPTPLYGIYQLDYGFSELMVTVIFATYAAGVIAALLLFGRVSDQIGRRRTLLPGLAFAALSAAVFLLAQGVVPLLAGRVLSGLSAGIFTGTATAALLDLAPKGDRGRATLVATIANVGGLATGPLLAGLLAEYAGAPLRLPFWVDLGLLLPAAVLIWALPETAGSSTLGRVRPQRLRVPAEVRPIFLRSALATFAGFAVLGLFTAVAPAFLAQILGIQNHATVGLLVFVVFASSIVGQTFFLRALGRAALSGGCLALIAGMGLVALGLAVSSLALLLAGGIVAALGQGAAFRAGLTAVNEASPPEHRAEVASSFFVVAYVALSVPIVGEGLLAQAVGLRPAGLIFAAVVAVFALAVLILLTVETGARREQALLT
jgi:MFS family permease